jgi:hypothetical protein
VDRLAGLRVERLDFELNGGFGVRDARSEKRDDERARTPGSKQPGSCLKRAPCGARPNATA